MKRFSAFATLSFLNAAGRRVLAGGVLLILAVLIGMAALMGRELHRTQAQDQRQLQLLASAMQAHASQVFDHTRLALDSLAKTLPGSTLEQLQALPSDRLQGLPFLRSLAVVSPKGVVLASSTASERGGRVDWQRLTPAPVTDERVVIGPWLPGRVLAEKKQGELVPERLGFIPMVRLVRLSPTTSVLLVAQIDPDTLVTYQQQLMATGSPGTQGFLALQNGTLLTQVGNDALEPGSSVQAYPLFQGLLSGHKGLYGPLLTVQSRHLGAWHRSDSMPVVSFVEQPYQTTLQQWRAALLGPLLFMVAALVLIGFITHVAWRSARARDQTQQETARREQELSVLFKSVQELIFRTDSQGALRFVNARWQAVTGQPVERARGQRLRDVVHPDCCPSVDALFNATPASGVGLARVHLQGTDGETRALDISVVPLRDRSGQLRGFAGSAVDVTALLAAQHGLQEQLDFTEQVLECSPLPICMTDPQGRVLSVNQAWESFMERRRANVLGLRNCDFLTPQEVQAYGANNDRLLREGGRVRYEKRVLRPDGSWRDVQITKVLVASRHHQPIGILSVKMDITEFRAARDLAEEASRSKSEFVANISHELRTPLQSILGFSELGLVRGHQHPALASMFDDIHAAGQRMLGLVNDLLDLAQIESTAGAFRFEHIDVRELIGEAASEMQLLLDHKRLNLVLELGRAPLVAKADPSRFQQVVRHVLANAVKFAPEGSAIGIAASTTGEHSIHIQVCDQGPGIPPAELDTVFQAFVQSSQTRNGSGGTGLGLAICRKIAAAHGGRIHATNAPGGGAIFHIVLPTAGHTDTLPATLR